MPQILCNNCHADPALVRWATFLLATLARLGARPRSPLAGAMFAVAILAGSQVAGGAEIPVETIALSGTHAPGVNANVLFGQFPTIQAITTPTVPPTINANGQVTFYGQLFGPGVTAANNMGLWSGAAGDVVLAARAGSSAGGAGAGVNYAGFVPPVQAGGAPYPVPSNAAGSLAYDAFLTGSTVTIANDEGLWVGPRSGPTIVAREGDAAPSTSPGTTYHAPGGSTGTTFSPTYINDAGHIGFTANLSSGALGIWAGGAGASQLVAQTGQQAPGTASGVHFATTPFFTSQPFLFEAVGMNASDAVVFSAGLTGPGVTPLNSGGIWSGTAGSVALVGAREIRPPACPPAQHSRIRLLVQTRSACQTSIPMGRLCSRPPYKASPPPARACGQGQPVTSAWWLHPAHSAGDAGRCDVRYQRLREPARTTRSSSAVE